MRVVNLNKGGPCKLDPIFFPLQEPSFFLYKNLACSLYEAKSDKNNKKIIFFWRQFLTISKHKCSKTREDAGRTHLIIDYAKPLLLWARIGGIIADIHHISECVVCFCVICKAERDRKGNDRNFKLRSFVIDHTRTLSNLFAFCSSPFEGRWWVCVCLSKL